MHPSNKLSPGICISPDLYNICLSVYRILDFEMDSSYLHQVIKVCISIYLLYYLTVYLYQITSSIIPKISFLWIFCRLVNLGSPPGYLIEITYLQGTHSGAIVGIQRYRGIQTATVGSRRIKEDIERNRRIHRRIQKDTEGYRSIKKDTEAYRRIQKDTEGYRSMQKDTEAYRRIQKDTEEYKRIQKDK